MVPITPTLDPTITPSNPLAMQATAIKVIHMTPVNATVNLSSNIINSNYYNNE